VSTTVSLRYALKTEVIAETQAITSYATASNN
jgi:hypothetical protein